LDPRETVQKSTPDANDPNDCLTGLFPFRQDVSKAASPDGAELMNRVSGRNSEDSEPEGKPGRPRTAGKGDSPLSKFDVSNPQTVIETDGKNIKAGSVLAVTMPDSNCDCSRSTVSRTSLFVSDAQTLCALRSALVVRLTAFILSQYRCRTLPAGVSPFAKIPVSMIDGRFICQV
jgi:hypothetical protein